jgi:hypothetical protein
MNASRNTKLGALAVVAVALVAAGGAFAAGWHHGSKGAAASGLTIGSFASSRSGGTYYGTGHGPGRGPSDEITAAANYLGISESDLLTSLQSGKTLAQIASATSGKSTAGLIDALVAAEKTEIAAAVSAGRLTQAEADQIIATLKDRFTSLVNGTLPDGHGFGGPFGHGHGDDLAAAATYLGISQTALETALQSGKTLAQVADATSGKSAAGLIDALVAHEKTELAAAVTAGRLTQAQADQLSANLKQRVTDLVNGVRPSHPFGDGPGPGGVPFEPGNSTQGGTHI